jgi:predicted dehydrogenase
MNTDLWQSFSESTDCDRRAFLANTGKGLLAGTVLSVLSGSEAAAQTAGPAPKGPEIKPVKFPPIDDPSEKPKADPFTPIEPAKRIGYCLVGLGRLTLGEIMPAFGHSKYAKPVALVSGDREKAKNVAAQYGIAEKNIYNYQNFDDIRNNPEIDVVYIVLPNSMHEEFTVRAAKAGKHVLCEKPMTTSAASAQRMIDACKKADKKLMIAYRVQYTPQHRAIMKWTREKKWGKVRVIELFNGQNQGDPSQWRQKKDLAGGGSLPDIGLYCLNTARFVLGEEPEWVTAQLYSTPGDPRFKEVEETVLFQMGFPGGAIVNASTSYSVHDTKRYRCLADKGASFGMDPAFSYHGLKMEVSEVRDGEVWKQSPEIEEKDQFALELDHMAHCIRNNKQPYTPGEEGLQDQKIMEAIYRAAKDKKAVMLDKITTIDTFRGPAPEEK